MLISVVFAIVISANTAEAQNWPQGDLGRSKKSNIPQISPTKITTLVPLKTLKEIEAHTRNGYLKPIPDGVAGVKVDGALDIRRRYCLSATIEFLELVGQIMEDKFKKEIIVSSCVRDVRSQKRIRKETGRGASAYRTTHLTGAAVDISRRNLSSREERFLDAWFSACVRRGTLKKFLKEGQKNSWGAHYHLDISPEFSYCGSSILYRPDVRVAMERYL